MRRKPKVILFARKPQYAKGKTRLQKGIGPIATLRFYKNTLANVTRRMASDPAFRFEVAITPDLAASQPLAILPPHVPLISQGGGDLGARMARALNTGEGAPTLIIGSDIPDFRPHHMKKALKALSTADIVFSPADDGGYSLIGVRRTAALPIGFMENVRWSTPHTLVDTLATLPKCWKVAYTDPVDDVDNADDYHKFSQRGKNRPYGP